MPTYLVRYYQGDHQRRYPFTAATAAAAKGRFADLQAKLPGRDHRLETRKGTFLAGTDPHAKRWKMKPRQLGLTTDGE